MAPKAWGSLKRLDAYARAEEHLSHQTLSGGIVSMCGISFMLVLFFSELRHFLSPEITKELSVDTTLGHTLPIRMNITLPALPCAILTVDALDASGGHQIDMEGDVHKMRLDLHGKELGLYEAPQGGKDLMNFFRGLNIQFFGFGGDMIQLVGPETVAQVEQAMSAHEGCRVQGKVQVAKVAGNFHIGVHSHSFQLLQEVFNGDARKVNVSHEVHELHFGKPFAGMVNPLDGMRRLVAAHEHSGTFKYFIKLVPTMVHGPRHKHHTYQFSVQEYFSAAARPGMDVALPAIYFVYDFSPITVNITERGRSLLHFLTRVCAVVGGVFAVTGMLDKAVFVVVKALGGGGAGRTL